MLMVAFIKLMVRLLGAIACLVALSGCGGAASNTADTSSSSVELVASSGSKSSMAVASFSSIANVSLSSSVAVSASVAFSSNSSLSSRSSSFSASAISTSNASVLSSLSSSKSSAKSSSVSLSAISSSRLSSSSSSRASSASASSLASANPCNRNNVLFCDDFEGGNFQKWDDYDGNPAPDNTIISEVGPHNITGNHVARLQAAVGTRSQADLTKMMPSSYDKLYLRYFQKFEDGFNFTAQNHAGGGIFANRNSAGRSDFRPSGSDYLWAIVEFEPTNLHLYSYYRGMYQNCADPNGQCWGDTFPCTFDEGATFCEKAEHRDLVPVVQPQANKWYCLEVMFDLSDAVQTDSAATGIQNFWVDGIAQGPFQHLWLRTTPNLKLEGIWLSSFFHNGQKNTSSILYDDVVVSTEAIGCNE